MDNIPLYCCRVDLGWPVTLRDGRGEEEEDLLVVLLGDMAHG